MDDIQIFVTWRGLELIVTVEEADCYAPDEWIPTVGYVEIDYRYIPARPRPLDEVIKGIQAQIDDEPDRFFNRIVELFSEKICEEGLIKYAEREVELAQRYAEERADWLYTLNKERRWR